MEYRGFDIEECERIDDEGYREAIDDMLEEIELEEEE